MTTHPTPEARYVLDFTATLDGGRAAVITDTVTQAGEYLYSDMDPFTFAMVDQQHRTIAALSAELAAARAEAATERALSFRDQVAQLETERDSLRAERDDLARWKSTHAPRIEALQGLKDHAQAEAAKGAEALASLASEREANAILTAEVEALRAEVERLREFFDADEHLGRVFDEVSPGLSSVPDGHEERRAQASARRIMARIEVLRARHAPPVAEGV